MIIKLCERWRQKKNELLIPLFILFTSCSTVQKGVEYVAEGREALTVQTATEVSTRTVDKSLFRIEEGLKVMALKDDLMLEKMAGLEKKLDRIERSTQHRGKEISDLRHELHNLKNVLAEHSVSTNKFILDKLKVVKELRARIKKLERSKG